VNLAKAVKHFADGKCDFNAVDRSYRALLRCCGGKVGDDSRLTYRDLQAVVKSGKDVEQAAKVFVQALAHEFEALHAELTNATTKQAAPETKKPEKPDSK